DHREQSGAVVRGLHALGVRLEARQLEVGDFVLSDRVVAERKSMRDFVDSLVDGRLFPQLRSLKAYPRPLLVLEGDSLLGHRNLSAEALYGALASVTVDYGIPVLQARDGAETARLLAAIAKREQSGAERKVAVRPGKGPMSDAERLVFILGGFPGVSDLLAQRLLSHFGSLQAVLDADAARLAAVEGIGSHKAGEIRRLLELDWLAPPPVRTETV
ncbi:MAG TPA: ERCC4 domain-containing protein, partial [Candidatus Thermoplasmatota archaeon]|nr:ERCC4 domain-containing protein [Candidatus Thermoplasmatota archaeon]